MKSLYTLIRNPEILSRIIIIICSPVGVCLTNLQVIFFSVSESTKTYFFTYLYTTSILITSYNRKTHFKYVRMIYAHGYTRKISHGNQEFTVEFM